MWNPRICHEMPPLAEDAGWGAEFNDYDYVLLHLLEDAKYKEWAKSLKETNRIVYLDNSCYELGESMDQNKLADAYLSLVPDYIFLPDVMGDHQLTYERSAKFVHFSKHFIPREKMIGVVQGKTPVDVAQIYQKFVDLGVGMIAFPFMLPWMKDASSLEHALARVKLLDMLKGIIDTSKPHHLLGTHHPEEFIHYRQYDWIASIDTSNPIMAAYDSQSLGINDTFAAYPVGIKPKSNLASVWNNPQLPSYNQVKHNCKIFREMVFGPHKEVKIVKKGRPETNSEDTINPRHYKIIINGQEIQVADIIDALELNWKRAFAVKYLLRAGDKPEQGMSQDEKELDDLKKAVWYTQREIKQLETKIKGHI